MKNLKIIHSRNLSISIKTNYGTCFVFELWVTGFNMSIQVLDKV